MKKLTFLLIILISSLSFAQVTFSPGIRAGLNLAKFTQSDNGIYNWFDEEPDPYYSNYQKEETDFIADFYVGFFGNIRFAKFYALQPELNYSRQGSKIKVANETYEPKISYLSLQLVNKFYFQKFNIHVGPSIDFALEDNGFNPSNNVDLGFLLGVGYDITNNFGIEARVKKGIVEVAYSGDENRTNVLLQAGVYYTFNTKK
ncbi:Outer membrane protein beta-barrel domain-containing protein [Chryseobacterium soldanellicola]|uniref:Outer membrane protein beta-barrel domain-containing protein n=1 Tax=Chryseobacterium soldanellicola TaxID=311333 RepID=A0A1H1BLA3_9FLAO|nr:outer membrane beta-barrel protein [Chryseobacterium soldanellicola]SDQ52659.1 Outer membrane protein beta-barrel domain-containing protein [Chryseobacterium soldanellicola]